MSKLTVWGVWLVTCAATLGCGSEDAGSNDNGSDTGGVGTGGTGGTAGSSSGTGGSGRGGSATGGSGGTRPGGVPHVDGEPDDSVDTDLPPVPRMVNVKAQVIGDNVSITFDPIDGAVDYRVYELPADSDISSDGDGFVTIDRVVGGQHRTVADPSACKVTLEKNGTTGVSGTATCKDLRWVDALRAGGSPTDPGFIKGEAPFDAEITFEAAP